MRTIIAGKKSIEMEGHTTFASVSHHFKLVKLLFLVKFGRYLLRPRCGRSGRGSQDSAD